MDSSKILLMIIKCMFENEKQVALYSSVTSAYMKCRGMGGVLVFADKEGVG